MERLEALPGRVHAVELQIMQLREEMRRYMRVLHEEVISRIATIGESRPRRPKR